MPNIAYNTFVLFDLLHCLTQAAFALFDLLYCLTPRRGGVDLLHRGAGHLPDCHRRQVLLPPEKYRERLLAGEEKDM